MSEYRPDSGILRGSCVLGLGLTVTLAGCGDGSAPSDAVVVDSAGVRVVDYPGVPVATHRITFASEPMYRYGHRDGDRPFQMILQGALDASGGAVVSDQGSQELMRIAPDGELDRILARGGRGPSEILMVRSIHPLGPDTLLVEDRGNGKLMYFVDGELADVVSTLGEGGIGRALSVRGVGEDGAFMTVTSSYSPEFEEPWLAGSMARFDRSTGVVDTVASFDMARRPSPDGSIDPFGPSGHAVVSGGSFVSARSDVPQLTWRRPDGTIHQLLRWSPEPVYPTQADWDDYVEGFGADMRAANPHLSASDIQPLIDNQLERLELRTDEPYPLYVDLQSAGTGGVWLGVFHAGSLQGPEAYHVVAADGSWLGTVDLPARFHILDIRDGRVLGVLRDEMDVQSVAVYSVEVEPL